MTYSTGPGGYPESPQGATGQGYGQPAPGYGAASSPGKGLPFFLNIGVIALGVISFFLGFAPYVSQNKDYSGRESRDSVSFFFNGAGSGVGIVSLSLLLAAALVAAFALFPKQPKQDVIVAALSVTGFISLLFLLFGVAGPFKAGLGLIFVLITSFLQAALAIVVLLFASGVIKPSQPRQAQYGYYGQPGYGQPQPQQPYYGAAPGAPATGPQYQAPPSQPLPQQQPPQQPPSSQPQPPQNPW
jgi:hypothetical protein